MNIIFFGTPEIAVNTLTSLKKDKDINVLGVITQPDKQVGRKKIITAPPVKTAAIKMGIKVFQPHTKKEIHELLIDKNADFFIVFAYGMILKKEILELPKIAAINIHTSILPKYRGASPIQEAIKNGDTQTGISIMKMDEKLDHGDVFKTIKTQITTKDTSISLSKKLSEISAENICRVLKEIQLEKLIGKKQDHNKASFCKKIKKEDGEINCDKKAIEIINMIRAYTPWPNVWTFYKNKKIKILEAEISNTEIEKGKFKVHEDSLLMGTLEGTINILKAQLEGKKEMEIKDFLNGYHSLFED